MGPLSREHFRDHQVTTSSLNPPPGGHASIICGSWTFFHEYYLTPTSFQVPAWLRLQGLACSLSLARVQSSAAPSARSFGKGHVLRLPARPVMCQWPQGHFSAWCWFFWFIYPFFWLWTYHFPMDRKNLTFKRPFTHILPANLIWNKLNFVISSPCFWSSF